MTDEELDRLLDGAEGVTVRLTSGVAVGLSRHELRDPVAWRAALRRAMGHVDDWQPPVYDQADHDQIVRVIFRLIETQEGVGVTPLEG